MKRSAIETLLGAFVLAVAGFFLVFSYQTADVGDVSGGYTISADFAGIGGLKPGDDVVISGVKIGAVDSVELVPDTFLARVNIEISDSVKLPTDTAALISSESLLGGRYLALEPGADEEIIKPGGRVQFTQAPQNLEQLLGQFIFSMKDGEKKTEAVSAESGVQPAAMQVPAPDVISPRVEDAPAPAPEPAAEETPAEPAHP